VTTLSALAARSGSFQWDDLQYQGKYAAMKAYGQSKLAEMLFALELNRRSRAAGWGIARAAACSGAISWDTCSAGGSTRRYLRLMPCLRRSGTLRQGWEMDL
jgi:hypothetical protein